MVGERQCDHLGCECPARWTPRIFVFMNRMMDPLAERPIEGGFAGNGIAVCDEHRDSDPSRYITDALMGPVNQRLGELGLTPADWSRTVIEFVPLGSSG